MAPSVCGSLLLSVSMSEGRDLTVVGEKIILFVQSILYIDPNKELVQR